MSILFIRSDRSEAKGVEGNLRFVSTSGGWPHLG
jgi:hypothetical protein